MTLSQIAMILAQKCEANKEIDLTASLPEEFSYNSLDLCVIDAVFSIGVKYEGVKNVITSYKKHIKNAYPIYDCKTRTVADAIAIFEDYSSVRNFAKDVLNLQRTSTKNGILKADASLQVLKILNRNGIENIDSFKHMNVEMQKKLDAEILSVKGQGSGIMLKYLYMLAGDDTVCKPDRMLHRYVSDISGRKMLDDELQIILTEAYNILKKDYPTLTVRILDNQIWQFQKSIKYKK